MNHFISDHGILIIKEIKQRLLSVRLLLLPSSFRWNNKNTIMMCLEDNLLFVFPRREQGEDICQHITPLQYNTNRAGVKVWWGICGIHYCTLEQSEKWGNLCGYLHPRSWGWAEGESGGGRGGENPRVQAARRLGRRGDCWMGRAGGGSPALALMHCCCI